MPSITDPRALLRAHPGTQVIVSDDGDRGAGRFAGYLLLDPAQLQTAS